MQDYESIISHLKRGPLMVEGSRNNDAVNLCIAAYDAKHRSDTDELLQDIEEVMDKEGLEFAAGYDRGDFIDRVDTIAGYLPGWDKIGIYQYAIV